MKITKINNNGVEIAIVQSQDLIITDVQSTLDLIATRDYEARCRRFVINKEAVIEDFFKLSIGIAGEIYKNLLFII